jgi:hypothetical protein
MSIASAQYDKFREQVVTDERVFTFTTGDGDVLVHPSRSGETVPFWSSRSRLEATQKRLPKYREFEITELSLAQFWVLLRDFEKEGLKIGVNWSGEGLMGFNVPVTDLRMGLESWIDRLGKRKIIEAVGEETLRPTDVNE